jgi:hypothetical protein
LTDETAPAELPTEGFDRAAIGVGYFFGSILPTLLGAPAVGG